MQPSSMAQFASRRYNVASHELYLGKIFAAGGSGNIFIAHYRGRTVAAKEILHTDSRTNSYTDLSVGVFFFIYLYFFSFGSSVLVPTSYCCCCGVLRARSLLFALFTVSIIVMSE